MKGYDSKEGGGRVKHNTELIIVKGVNKSLFLLLCWIISATKMSKIDFDLPGAKIFYFS